MEVTIDSCTWAANEAGGPVELNVDFTVVRLGPESLFATYRVEDTNSSLIYKPLGSKANLTAYPDAPAVESLSTSRFEVGSTGLELVISGQRRKTVRFPQDPCTERLTHGVLTLELSMKNLPLPCVREAGIYR